MNIESYLHEHHYDHNLRAAYLHVLADALTSLLAIIALLAGNLDITKIKNASMNYG